MKGTDRDGEGKGEWEGGQKDVVRKRKKFRYMMEG